MSHDYMSVDVQDGGTVKLCAEEEVALLKLVIRRNLPAPDETGHVRPRQTEIDAIINAAVAFQDFIGELRSGPVSPAELLTPELRVDALRCLAKAMMVVPNSTEQWVGYFMSLQSIALATANWEAGRPHPRYEQLGSGGMDVNIPSCKLPGIEAVAQDLLESVVNSWWLLQAFTESLREASPLREDKSGEFTAFCLHQKFARTMAILLVWFRGMQGLGDDAAIVQNGKAILLQAYQEAVGQTLLRGADLDALEDGNIIYEESMDFSMMFPVVLHSLCCCEPALLHAMLVSCTEALEAITVEPRSPTGVEQLSMRLRLLHAGCWVALDTRPQPPPASVAACLAAWRPLATERALFRMLMTDTAKRFIKRLVARLEATKKAQERAAAAAAKAAKQEAAVQVTAASQAEADAAMRALLAEEEAAAEAAQRQAAKKGRKKARQAAKKAAGERQAEAAPQQQANSAVDLPGSRLRAPGTLVAQRLEGSPRQQDASAESDVCIGSASPSAVGSEQGSGPSHSRDLEHAPAGSQPQPPRELLDSPAAAEQDSLATQAASLALDPPRSPVATPAAPPARPRPRPPQRGGGQQALPSVCQPTAASSQAGGSSQQLLNRLQLEELCTCPITQELFVEPVIASDGFTYERAAIEAWIARKGVSPMTEAPLALSSLQPSIAASQMVAVFHSLGR